MRIGGFEIHKNDDGTFTTVLFGRNGDIVSETIESNKNAALRVLYYTLSMVRPGISDSDLDVAWKMAKDVNAEKANKRDNAD